ncbi:hypothetical protein SUGI_0649990 [Cryptomeria japonica]|uniref:acid phosphatase 1 n=1 Tax=Cryptomeria japonica TaxID=3369 RepID=UPI00241472B8|nr:acid phosphatase 1 [Cryptomeria japonica]GLJ32301.1 hypothetical protein SUGI_0649990 [Cryptomeria japonica]
MERSSVVLVGHLLVLLALVPVGSSWDKWSIINPMMQIKPNVKLKYSLKNYCESWRMNVELNNIRDFEVVPGECVYYIENYMTSKQYKVDQERVVEQALLYLTVIDLAGHGKEAWIFDVDDTLLSTIPYFRDHSFGGEVTDRASIEKWMGEVKAPAMEAVLPLYNKLKMKGVKILIITGRGEHLRSATAENLVRSGFTGWTELIMREAEDNYKTTLAFKSEKRKQLVKEGYHILGNVGDQWSDILGSEAGIRTFKLPNSMYYTA